jgi:hypothetical protein
LGTSGGFESNADRVGLPASILVRIRTSSGSAPTAHCGRLQA